MIKPIRVVIAAALLCAVVCLTGCSELFPKSGQNLNMETAAYVPGSPDLTPVLPEGWDETTEPEDLSQVETLTMSVTEKTIRKLEDYPNLKTLDLSDSTCYTAIMVYIRSHPEVEVTYSVDLGGAYAINWAEDIVLPSEGVNYSLIQKNLIFLPNLRSVHLPKTGLTLEQIQMLRKTYPEITFTYTVAYRDMEWAEETEELNLAGITMADLEEAARALPMLPNLKYVELMNASGTCSLSRQEVKQLVEAVPSARFHYVFNLFGKTVSTTDDQVYFKGLSLTPNAEPEIREALDIMAPGSSLVLDNCGLSSELLDSIRKDYDSVDLVWRVFFGTQGRYSTLTNDDTIRCVYNITDDTCYEMRYLRSVKYMDLGHNDTLTDLSFLGFMPDLEIAILSGCAASKLDGIENCKKLEFLELANCRKLEDLSALAGCDSLKYLNICFTKVSNLMPLDGLGIRNLFCKRTRVPAEEQKQFKEIHPDAVAVFTGNDPYAGPGWRYTDYGYTYTDFYKRVREVFNLDSVDKVLRAQKAAEGN